MQGHELRRDNTCPQLGVATRGGFEVESWLARLGRPAGEGGAPVEKADLLAATGSLVQGHLRAPEQGNRG